MFFSFLGGYADAEGHFGITSSKSSRFLIFSYDKTILKKIRTKFLEYHVDCPPVRITAKKGYVCKAKPLPLRKDVWGLSVYQRSSNYKLIKSLGKFT